jgi:hypothetical protein
VKGQRYPFYYGIQPTGTYPDQPFIGEYYNGANTGLLINGATLVPQLQPVIPTPPPCNDCAR